MVDRTGQCQIGLAGGSRSSSDCFIVFLRNLELLSNPIIVPVLCWVAAQFVNILAALLFWSRLSFFFFFFLGFFLLFFFFFFLGGVFFRSK